jgi:uncharacterized DUF497 family protein
VTNCVRKGRAAHHCQFGLLNGSGDTPPNNSFNPTYLSLPFINLVLRDVARVVASGGGLIRALGISRYRNLTIESADAILPFMEFEWDEEKAAANLAKHGVSFEEAMTVFDDPLYVDFYDPDHSVDEHRYIIIGESQKRRLLIVSYTERDDVVRLISTREVTRGERETYEEG